jgi:hypothetical protein
MHDKVRIQIPRADPDPGPENLSESITDIGLLGTMLSEPRFMIKDADPDPQH